jgi:hypothetical protein
MKKIFRTDEERTRMKLLRMQHDDVNECTKSTLAAISRTLRERLTREYPRAPPDWIEVAVDRHLHKGLKPTTATLPASKGIPATAMAAQKAARKAFCKNGRHRRK